MARDNGGREETHIGHGPRIRLETAWVVALAAIVGMAVVAGLVVFFTLGRGAGPTTPAAVATPVPTPAPVVVPTPTPTSVPVVVLAPTPTPKATPTPTAIPTRGPTPAPPTPTTAPPVAAALEISSVGEEFKFDQSKITAKAGTSVVLRFKNNAKTPGLQHNWVLVKQGTKDAVATAGTTTGPTNDWIPRNDARVIANTKLVDPGKTGEVRFTAPEQYRPLGRSLLSGEYQFVCTFPGHNITMFGEFLVTP